jgi:1,4-dihydroxy-2-naphthoate polyprenyltransferase
MTEITDTIKLLRFPFSLFLLPVTLFSFLYIQPSWNISVWLALGIWHLLVFPSSNGYNSYNDQDDGPIGGLAAPPKPTLFLKNCCNVMDVLAISLSALINTYFFFFVLIYIIASRLYSYRRIRLKKYPVAGFLIVFVFQGAWVFCGNILALSGLDLLLQEQVIFSAIASSFFIGTVYPLTQIYQHEADKTDGVVTLSMQLGIKGTFVFSGLMFFAATTFMYFTFYDNINYFWLFTIVMGLSAFYFGRWALVSFRDPVHVNFRNVMIMLVLSSLSNNIFFLILLNK